MSSVPSRAPGFTPTSTAKRFAISLICFAVWFFYVRRAVSDQEQALADMIAGLQSSNRQRNIEGARSRYVGDVFFSHLALIVAVLLSYGGAILLVVGNVASKIVHGKKLKLASKANGVSEKRVDEGDDSARIAER